MNDPAETLVTESLESHAASAPSDATLLGTVHRRLRRRRRARSAGVAVLACAAVAVAGVGIRSLVHPTAAPGPTASIAQPPPGWHWESYANVEVQVPDQWTEISAGRLTTCASKRPAWDGWVGRPSALPTIAMGCGSEVSALADRVPYLLFTFNETPGVKQYDAGWTREVRAVGALQVEVFGADAAVRTRVLDSARTIDGVDSNGCAPAHAVATQPSYRPTGKGLASVGTAESIQICAYKSAASSRIPPLLASASLSGDQARDVGAALRAAPESGAFTTSHPDRPATVKGALCLTGDPEVFVLRVRSDRGAQEVVVRLNGCGPFDIDDGVDFRVPTKPAVEPLVTAVGRPQSPGPFLTNLLK
ncbi:hypothetical protein [Kribbella endophytica]